ncbi:MAG: hypothetical protein ACI4EJ_00185 [Bacteroides sp.]
MKRYPVFYVWGRATHVGQCYEGFCATTIAALISQIMETKNATTLELNDLKPEYNVQTPSDAYASFEVQDTPEFMKSMTDVAGKAAESMLELLNERRKKYCEICHMKFVPYEYDTKIFTLDDLYKLTGKENADGRASLEEVMELFKMSGIKTPAIVIFEERSGLA